MLKAILMIFKEVLRLLDTVRRFAVKWLLEPTPQSGYSITIRKTDDNGDWVEGANMALNFFSTNNGDSVTVSGAEKNIYSSYSTHIEFLTQKSPVVISGLLPGKYELYEQLVPNGYESAGWVDFEIMADGTISAANTDTIKINSATFDVTDVIIPDPSGIRFVICIVPPETFAEFANVKDLVISTGTETTTTTDGSVFVTNSRDIFTLKDIMAVKIYNNDEYLGTYVRAEKCSITHNGEVIGYYYKPAGAGGQMPYCSSEERYHETVYEDGTVKYYRIYDDAGPIVSVEPVRFYTKIATSQNIGFGKAKMAFLQIIDNNGNAETRTGYCTENEPPLWNPRINIGLRNDCIYADGLDYKKVRRYIDLFNQNSRAIEYDLPIENEEE